MKKLKSIQKFQIIVLRSHNWGLIMIKFENINKYILFGGSIILLDFAVYLKNSCKDVVVYSSERHLNEPIKSGITLQQLLEVECIHFYSVPDINKELINTDDVIGISFGAPWVFKKEFIERFNGRLLNCHGTRLPYYRGGGGHSWRIMRGNRLGNCLLHLVNTGIDTGDIVFQKSFYYPVSCRKPIDYDDYYHDKVLKFLAEFVSNVSNGHSFEPVKQQDIFSTYYPRLNTKEHGFIDWSWDIKDIESFICAFDEPYPGASTFLDGIRLIIKDVLTDFNDGAFHPFQTGIIYRITEDSVFVACKGGSLVIKKIINEDGSNAIKHLKLGDRLHTPLCKLEAAMMIRQKYTSHGIGGHESN